MKKKKDVRAQLQINTNISQLQPEPADPVNTKPIDLIGTKSGQAAVAKLVAIGVNASTIRASVADTLIVTKPFDAMIALVKADPAQRASLLAEIRSGKIRFAPGKISPAGVKQLREAIKESGAVLTQSASQKLVP